MKLAVTALAAAIVIAAGAILLSLGSTARGARPAIFSVPGLHLENLPVERAVSFVVPTGLMPAAVPQTQGMGAPCFAHEQSLPANVGFVLTHISNSRHPSGAGAILSLVVNGQPRLAATCYPNQAVQAQLSPILIPPGATFRLEFFPDGFGSSSAVGGLCTVQGYYVLDSELTPQ